MKIRWKLEGFLEEGQSFPQRSFEDEGKSKQIPPIGRRMGFPLSSCLPSAIPNFKVVKSPVQITFRPFFYIGMIFFKGHSFCHELLPNFFLGYHLGDFPYFKLLQDLGVMKNLILPEARHDTGRRTRRKE